MKEDKNLTTGLLGEINNKLDMILFSISLQGKTPEDKVKLLSSFNYGNTDISKIAGIPIKTVDNIKNRKLKTKKVKNVNKKSEKK
jgi:hypothetical protein